MKKILSKIVVATIGIVSLCCNFCYADLVVQPDDRVINWNPSPVSESVETFNIWPLVIIGIVIAILVGVAIIVLVKNNKKEEKK
ncbi:MAG: hypothetical protein J6M60_07470 [Clostridia bacterium]|nr:hypothetical protein [Clostridia bacterium]